MFLLKRPVIDIAILILIIFGWWHMALVLALYGLLRFRTYFEIIIFGLVYDSLFRMTSNMGASEYLGTILGVGIFGLYFLIKGAIRK